MFSRDELGTYSTGWSEGYGMKKTPKRLSKSELLALVRPDFSEIASLRLDRKTDLAKLRSYVPVTYEKQFLMELTAEMTPYMKRWVSTGNCSHLVDLLRLEPGTMFTHFMGLQIIHLRNLVSSYSMEEAEEEYMEHGVGGPLDDALPYGVKPAAITALHLLLAAWADKLLPGSVLSPPKPKARPAHRPNKWDHMDVLLEYNNLREQLEVIAEEDASGLGRKTKETEAAFLERMIHVTQRLHLGTTYCMGSPPVSRGSRFLALRPQALNSDIAKSITAQAIGRKGLSRNALIYGLMSHYRNRKMGAIRRAVEWAQKLYPDEKRRQASTP